jgi:hypothetical protein
MWSLQRLTSLGLLLLTIVVAIVMINVSQLTDNLTRSIQQVNTLAKLTADGFAACLPHDSIAAGTIRVWIDPGVAFDSTNPNHYRVETCFDFNGKAWNSWEEAPREWGEAHEQGITLTTSDSDVDSAWGGFMVADEVVWHEPTIGPPWPETTWIPAAWIADTASEPRFHFWWEDGE